MFNELERVEEIMFIAYFTVLLLDDWKSLKTILYGPIT
jgi:hypothetical protein